jgi:hypothetical protein
MLRAVADRAGPGVREKLRRAHMHREDFERRVERFINTGAYSVIRQDNVEDQKRLWIFQAHKRPPLARWGALIGECLFSFRSALDHLAYDLAVAYTGTLNAKQERESEFPIFHWRAPKKRELDSRIGAVHPDARRLIETMQPYGRTDRAALKYLDVLHNFDKHRTLHLVLGVSLGASYFGETLEFVDFINFGSLKHGDPLAQIPLRPEIEDHGDPHFIFGVAFDKTGPGAKAPDVPMTLRWIGGHIDRGVIEPLLPYL